MSEQKQRENTVLRCAKCGLPFAKISHGALLITSYHHGEQHVNTVSLDLIRELLAEANKTMAE